jgi:hypothetical protein
VNPIASLSAGVLASFIAVAANSVPATAQQARQPNILVIRGDDIGVGS